MSETPNNLNPLECYAELLCDIGAILLSSGANCGRVESNVTRFAVSFGIETEILCSYSGLLITSRLSRDPSKKVTSQRMISEHTINFNTLNKISLLSWKVKEKKTSYQEVALELEKIKGLPRYPQWVTLLIIGASSGSLCMIIGGDWKDGLFALVGSYIGLSARFMLNSRKFNPMIGIVVGAFITTLITGIDAAFHIGSSPEKAMSMSVLYLVPGVQLLNCATDLIEGYMSPAVSRGMAAGVTLLCIATGMSLGIFLTGVNNY